MNVPKDLRYTKTHEWVRQDEGGLTVGITDFAQSQLSDLTYAELPAVGDKVEAQDELAVLESVKAASDVYAPFAGTIIEVNDQLTDSPEIINADPYGEGWMFKIEPNNLSDFDDLLDADQYEDALPDE